MKLWVKSATHGEGKFLVVRRDGSIPAWPHFVIGARDPSAPIALRAYADASESLGLDPEYVASIRELASNFERYRKGEGAGDPDAPPHRKDDPDVIEVMRGSDGTMTVWHSTNEPKPAAPFTSQAVATNQGSKE